jgi:DnaJ-domain-containing protein 1
VDNHDCARCIETSKDHRAHREVLEEVVTLSEQMQGQFDVVKAMITNERRRRANSKRVDARLMTLPVKEVRHFQTS